ncbi:hypothetical protein DPMN_077442 [Dreissena polymorpha]|uniref:Uncharacterized protein n=1 Tax=Dreissena polymorpha TaxID=45954 RepID=A0A9D3YP97_DREPO|nr:hypothetical protein DPMN_077442 [Dreissena polymorpha]
MNVTKCTSPDKFVEIYQGNPEYLQEMLQKVPENGGDIKFQQWKKVKLAYGKERLRVV